MIQPVTARLLGDRSDDTMTRMTARVSRLRRRQTLEFNEERADAELAATNSAYREAKKQLKIAILRSKRTCWKELISSVAADPFGKPYKLVMRKLRGPPPTASMEYATLQSVVDSLFPEHRARTDGPPVPADSVVPFTASEVDAAVERAGSRNKAPGPDGLTGKILRAVHKAHPNILLGLYNSCLRSGTFPTEWKTSRVVLLKKGNKPDGVPSSYRPLCLLNDVGKTLEFLLARRLEDHMSDSGGLSANQYGFRKGKSTDDAVRELQAYLLEGVNGGNFCLAVSIDVRNAFNTVKWSDILDALPRWRVPQYLLNMFRSYFSGRTGTVHANCAEGGTLEIEISGGVPQGSVVGPLLWNATFDAVMRTELPSGAKLLGFADDTMLVTRAKSTQELEAVTNEALSLVEQRITGLGLQIAVEKTEAVLFTYKYKYTEPAIKLCGGDVELSTEMNYLGMVVDRSMLFKGQVKKAAARAAGIGNQLARIMPNVGGPREDRRRLLSSVVHSVLLYGAPSWAHTLELVPGNVQTLNRAQRKVLLRCICAYRTVSKAATNVIASTPPADLLAVERMAAFDRRRAPAAPTAGDVPRTKTMEAWQERWSTEESGSWTRRLIPDVRPWCARSHGLVTNFHLTQFLSGHGCFGQYLHRFRKSDNPSIDDFFNDPDYGNPNSPIEVSDFEDGFDYEKYDYNKQSTPADNILAYDTDVEENIGSENFGSVQVIDDSTEEDEVHKPKALGLEHTSIRGKQVMPRSIGPDCKCRSKCFTKVNSSERDMILENFNKIGHKEKQDTYIVGLIKLQAISRNRPRKNSKPKKISCFYKFRIGNVEKCVRKKAFCSILGIGKSRVERIVKLMQNNVPSPVDKRGKHNNRSNKKSDIVMFQIESHIESFPARQSHYSRSKNENVKYLTPDLNITKMYELYMLKYEPDTWKSIQDKFEGVKPIVSYDLYRKHFLTNYNLSFGYPRSDTCQTCDRLQNCITTSVEEVAKTNFETEKKIHLMKAEVFYSDIKQKTLEAKEEFSKLEVLAFDFQQNLPLPHVPLTENLFGLKTIIHRYPEPGHSFLPCDRAFGLIEKRRRKLEHVFLPDTYRELVKSTCKTFSVIDVKQDMILNFAEHFKQLFKKIVTNRNIEKFSILSYRFMEYTKQGLNASVSVHSTAKENFILQKPSTKILSLPPPSYKMYIGPLGLKPAKLKDVRDLSSKYVPPQYMWYYMALTSITDNDFIDSED
ncbi:hypothetical protein QTP88_004645 [Uroleucon formosanum]